MSKITEQRTTKNAKLVKKTSVDPELAKLLELPTEHLGYLEVQDRSTVNGDAEIVLIRTIQGYREGLEQAIFNALPENERSEIKRKAISKMTFDVDEFDSGVGYLIETDNNGAKTARVVILRDDYPQKATLQPAVVKPFINNLDQQLREWKEGSVLSVSTILIDGKLHTVISSRTKIRCNKSKWYHRDDCPYTEDAFRETLKNMDVDFADLQIPNTCFMFILIHPLNQIIHVLKDDEPRLIHVKTYQTDPANLKKMKVIEMDIPKIPRLPILTKEEAINIIMNDGVVMTCLEKRNTKFLLLNTEVLYSQLGDSKLDPVWVWYKLNNPASKLDLERFLRYLQGPNLEKVKQAMEGYDYNMHKAAEFLVQRAAQHKNNKANSDVKVKRDKDLDYKGFEDAARHLRQAYYNAKKDAIDTGRFNPDASSKIKKNHKGKQNNRPAKFFLGVTKEDTYQKEIQIMLEYLKNLQVRDGEALAKLIGKCQRVVKKEAYLLKKLQSNDNRDKFKFSKEDLAPDALLFGTWCEEDGEGYWMPNQLDFDNLEPGNDDKWGDIVIEPSANSY